jgi:hypothetical protein
MFKAHLHFLGVGLDRLERKLLAVRSAEVQHVIGQGADNALMSFYNYWQPAESSSSSRISLLTSVMAQFTSGPSDSCDWKERFTLIPALFRNLDFFPTHRRISIGRCCSLWFWITGGGCTRWRREFSRYPIEVITKFKIGEGKEEVHKGVSSYIGVTTAASIGDTCFVLMSPQEIIVGNSRFNSK